MSEGITNHQEVLDDNLVIEGILVKEVIIDYYTVVVHYDEEFHWYGTAILEDSKEKALQRLTSYSGIKKYHLVKISLPTMTKEEIK